jgi:hypothetical protein
MSRQILFVALLFHASTCISQQEILLIGTHHITASDRLKEIIPVARAVESFRPAIICVEYPIGTDN